MDIITFLTNLAESLGWFVIGYYFMAAILNAGRYLYYWNKQRKYHKEFLHGVKEK